MDIDADRIPCDYGFPQDRELIAEMLAERPDVAFAQHSNTGFSLRLREPAQELNALTQDELEAMRQRHHNFLHNLPDGACADLSDTMLLAEADAGAVWPASHYDYLRCLREFSEAFRMINRLYAESPAEIFNYTPGCRPEELLPMADWVNNGGSADEAYVFAKSGGFQPVRYAADRVMEAWQFREKGSENCYGFAKMQDEYGVKADQMPRLMEELRGREGLVALEVDEENGLFRVRFKPYALTREAPDAMAQDDLEITHARHTLWCYGQPDGEQADFSGQELHGLDFRRMQFCEANFAGAVMERCVLDGGCFQNCDFTGADLRAVSAEGTDFAGARFDGAAFEDTDFSQADISDCTGLDGISQSPAMRMEG